MPISVQSETQGTEPAATIIRDSHAGIAAMAEKAMGQALNGSPADAVRLLLAQGEQTRNAKLIELAGMVAQRHHDRITDVAALSAQAQDLARRSCSRGAHLIGSKHGGRSAGGLSLRA